MFYLVSCIGHVGLICLSVNKADPGLSEHFQKPHDRSLISFIARHVEQRNVYSGRDGNLGD